jgi:hypothetical protein
LPAEGFAVGPDLTDPTGVLAAAFGDLASPLIAGGVLRYYLLTPRCRACPKRCRTPDSGATASTASSRRRSSAVAVHVAGAGSYLLGLCQTSTKTRWTTSGASLGPT